MEDRRWVMKKAGWSFIARLDYVTIRGQHKDKHTLTWSIFGMCEVAEVPGENLCMHWENMQTPSRNSNQGSSGCKAAVPTNVPPCSLSTNQNSYTQDKHVRGSNII
ncbi:hypothetical protein AMECASPLE_022512 [Ameca splendens]|uniref:Uncharacterized protein n=1 Tax=Ameca splendens TaxID=208324 RepID=A0ABV1ACS7_9TELE